MTIPLQSGIVYGPVKSRRLGVSLGVNILPTDFKLCSFNCVYCQYGFTKIKANRIAAFANDFPSPDLIRSEVEKCLGGINQNQSGLDSITFAGNGEPTLHPALNNIVDGVREVKLKYSPSAKLAILSNASQVIDSRVREALNKLDERIMKLDAGSPQRIKYINQPRYGFVLDEVLAGLKLLKDAIIQSLFFMGVLDNSTDRAVDEWIEAIDIIKPKSVQVYTLDRPPAVQDLKPVGRERLEEIARRATLATGIRTDVF